MWNRDYTISENCPEREYRGGYPYFAPAGWQRYGMDVIDKFPEGNAWLGCSGEKGKGEWALVYHGTSFENLKGITESPMHPGPRADRNIHGYGIYCSPKPETAERYTDCLELHQQSGVHKYKFMFMCRVNMRKIHICEQAPCPLDRDNQYTVHITQSPDDEWFVNCQNQSYQNIRPYGILVKEV
jgi:hypothetical protein